MQPGALSVAGSKCPESQETDQGPSPCKLELQRLGDSRQTEASSSETTGQTAQQPVNVERCVQDLGIAIISNVTLAFRKETGLGLLERLQV